MHIAGMSTCLNLESISQKMLFFSPDFVYIQYIKCSRAGTDLEEFVLYVKLFCKGKKNT